MTNTANAGERSLLDTALDCLHKAQQPQGERYAEIGIGYATAAVAEAIAGLHPKQNQEKAAELLRAQILGAEMRAEARQA